MNITELVEYLDLKVSYAYNSKGHKVWTLHNGKEEVGKFNSANLLSFLKGVRWERVRKEIELYGRDLTDAEMNQIVAETRKSAGLD